MPFGMNSVLLISSPSAAFVFTISGTTCAAVGKLAASVGNTRLGAPPADGTIAIDAGVFASKEITASDVPLASGWGDVSMPSPLETRRGVPPDVGTAQMCRRSISVAFVL